MHSGTAMRGASARSAQAVAALLLSLIFLWAPLPRGLGQSVLVQEEPQPLSADPCANCPAAGTAALSSSQKASAARKGAAGLKTQEEGGTEAPAEAAAPSTLRVPGLTPLPASQRMPPPAPPSPTAIADKQSWQTLDQQGIKVIVLGEAHHDPAMVQKQQNFLQLARLHGVQTLVIEYPQSEQAALDRYLSDPTYRNMADAIYGIDPHPKSAKSAPTREQIVSEEAPKLQAVELKDKGAIRRLGLSASDIADYEADIRWMRQKLAAHRIGLRVVAGDLPRDRGLSASGEPIPPERHPTEEEIERYMLSGPGMTDRNRSIAKATAQGAQGGRVVVIVGSSHTGFLPRERMLGRAPRETYPGLNYLLEKDYGLASVALAQNEISPQGYNLMGEGVTSTIPHREINRALAAEVAQDPFRSPIDSEPRRPIEERLPDGAERRERALEALPELRSIK